MYINRILEINVSVLIVILEVNRMNSLTRQYCFTGFKKTNYLIYTGDT